jgi:hypothetical protein
MDQQSKIATHFCQHSKHSKPPILCIGRDYLKWCETGEV